MDTGHDGHQGTSRTGRRAPDTPQQAATGQDLGRTAAVVRRRGSLPLRGGRRRPRWATCPRQSRAVPVGLRPNSQHRRGSDRGLRMALALNLRGVDRAQRGAEVVGLRIGRARRTARNSCGDRRRTLEWNLWNSTPVTPIPARAHRELGCTRPAAVTSGPHRGPGDGRLAADESTLDQRLTGTFRLWARRTVECLPRSVGSGSRVIATPTTGAPVLAKPPGAAPSWAGAFLHRPLRP